MEKSTDLIELSEKTNTNLFRERAMDQAYRIIQNKDQYNPECYGFGLEREYYTAKDSSLVPCSKMVFDKEGVQKELGVHNVETACEPGTNISHTINRLREKVRWIEDNLQDKTLVRDGGLVAYPKNQSIMEYLSSSTEIDGYEVPDNMFHKPYYVLLNHDISKNKNKSFTHPKISYKYSGLMPVCTTTSIQPHVQVPNISSVSEYFSAALRATGPILSIATNSPYLPPELYDTEPDYRPSVHENRVLIQNDLLNRRGRKGSRFPFDVDGFEDIVKRMSTHELFMPILSEDAPLVEWDKTQHEFNHQQRTTWWWVNPRLGSCVGGDSMAVRLELRSLPTQPTFLDNISMFSLAVGSIVEMAETSHPVLDLDWKRAKQNFENAVYNGPEADLVWIDEEKEKILDNEKIIENLIDLGQKGLIRLGLDTDRADSLLDPVRQRKTETPSSWKAKRYKHYTQTENMSSDDALRAMSKEYIEKSRSGNPFHTW